MHRALLDRVKSPMLPHCTSWTVTGLKESDCCGLLPDKVELSRANQPGRTMKAVEPVGSSSVVVPAGSSAVVPADYFASTVRLLSMLVPNPTERDLL